MAQNDPQYPQDEERADGTVEPDENDNSSAHGVPPSSASLTDGSTGGSEPAGRE